MHIDLTRLTTHGMPVYPGDTPPKLVEHVHFDQHSCVNHQFEGSMHVGTHMDGPMHMVKGGRKLCDLEVEHFFGAGKLVDARGKRVLDVDLLENGNIQSGDIVLFWTAWSEKFGDESYFTEFPVLTPALAEKLADLQVKMIGLDSPSPDREPYTVHRILLQKEILIVENLMNLAALQGKSFDITALPSKWDADSAPVRVIGTLR